MILGGLLVSDLSSYSKSSCALGYPRGNADYTVSFKMIEHAVLGYRENRTHEGYKKEKEQDSLGNLLSNQETGIQLGF